jgi:isopentenyl-diphosphate delta-isomerase
MAAASPDPQQLSMDLSRVILVDRDDHELGRMDKRTAHRKSPDPHLHRAFSLFLFDQEGRLLLQQRSQTKITFPLIWANSCCSHPEPDEPILAAAARRASFELNVQLDESAQLRDLGSFCYRADYDAEWAEYEVDHVVFGFYNEPMVNFNKDEVQAVKWVTKTELEQWIRTRPSELSVWLQKIWAVFLAPSWEKWVSKSEIEVLGNGPIDLTSEGGSVSQ